MSWKNIDADIRDEKFEEELMCATKRLVLAGVESSNEIAVLDKLLTDYSCGNAPKLERVLYVYCYKPDEFPYKEEDTAALDELGVFLFKNEFDWGNNRSDALKQPLNKEFNSAGATTIPGRKSRILDALLRVKDRVVAVEIESSHNIDNGYLSLYESLKRGMADMGVMIVTYTPKANFCGDANGVFSYSKSNRADVDDAIGVLDSFMEGADGSIVQTGNIYAVVVCRVIDGLRLLKEKSESE